MYTINYYLKEIRFRVFYIIFSFLSSCCFIYIFIHDFFYLMTNSLFPSQKNDILYSVNRAYCVDSVWPEANTNHAKLDIGSEVLCLAEGQYQRGQYQTVSSFIFTDIPEAFQTSLTFALGLSFYLIIPLVIYNSWSFLVPSFFLKERKNFSKDCTLFLCFYLMASISVLYIIFPFFFYFFLNFETVTEFVRIQCEARISSYISFIFKICFFTHILFEIPFILSILLKYRWLEINILFANRRSLYFIILFVCAFFSPPDIFMQFFLSLLCVFFLETYLFYRIYVGKASAKFSSSKKD